MTYKVNLREGPNQKRVGIYLSIKLSFDEIHDTIVVPKSSPLDVDDNLSNQEQVQNDKRSKHF